MALPAALRRPSLLTLTLLVSCACAAAGFYVRHPVLLPMLAHSISDIRSVVPARLNPALLFVFLNLLVVALASMPHSRSKLHSNTPTDDCSNPGPITRGGSACSVSLTLDDPADSTHNQDAQATSADHHDGTPEAPSHSCHDPELRQQHTTEYRIPDLSSADARKLHPNSDTRSRKSASYRSRNIVRSVSDGITLMHAAFVTPQKTPEQLRPFPRPLKKAGTSESSLRHRRVKPVVVVRDQPEEGQVVEEEVDRKAEEFIGSFYRRMKLQR